MPYTIHTYLHQVVAIDRNNLDRHGILSSLGKSRVRITRYHTSWDMSYFLVWIFGPVTDRQTDRQTDGQKAMHMSPLCISTGVLKNANLILFYNCLPTHWYFYYRPRSRGDNTFGSVRLSVNALTAELKNIIECSSQGAFKMVAYLICYLFDRLRHCGR